MTFCPRCATRLPGPPPISCTACAYELYVNARPTATVIIVQDGTFLAIRRAIEPKLGLWELPGGFCHGREHPEDAAVREAMEELGVTVHLGRFVGMYLGDYDFQGEVLPVLDCVWLATIAEGRISLATTEASEHAWFPLRNPPELAFESENRALIDVLKFV